MREIKRWTRLRLFMLGRWLMRRYQKPVVFSVTRGLDENDMEIGRLLRDTTERSRIRRCHGTVRRVTDPEELLNLIEGQPG